MAMTEPSQPAAMPETRPGGRGQWRKRMTEIILAAAFIAFYFLLQMVILPRLGFET